MTRLLRAVATAVIIGIASILASFSIPGAEANHTESVTDPVPVLLELSYSPTGRIDLTNTGLQVPVVAHNLVTLNDSGPIPVCVQEPETDENGERVPGPEGDSYQSDVTAAIQVWNQGLDLDDDVDIFRFAGQETLDANGNWTAQNCPKAADPWNDSGIASILVRANPFRSDCPGRANCAVPYGIALLPTHSYGVSPDPRYTFVGQTQILVSRINYYDPDLLASDQVFTLREKPYVGRKQRALFAHEFGHAFGFSHLWSRRAYRVNEGTAWKERYTLSGCPGYFSVTDESKNTQSIMDDSTSPPRWGFDYTDHTDADQFYPLLDDEARLFAVLSEPVHGGALMSPAAPCLGDTKITDHNTGGEAWEKLGEWRYENEPTLDSYTKAVYRKVYNPSSPTSLDVVQKPGSNVRLTWNASHVHVEKSFALQVKVVYLPLEGEPPGIIGTGWVTVETAAANTSTALIEQPTDLEGEYEISHPVGGIATFRVISLTDALGSPQPGNDGTPPMAVLASPPTPSPPPRDCTLTVTHDDGGTTSQSAQTVRCGGMITATATKDACYDFTGWTGDATSSGSSITVTMNESKSIRAGFARDGSQHRLMVYVTGVGDVQVEGGDHALYDCGRVVTVRAITSDPSWVFDRWEPESLGTSSTAQVHMIHSGWIRAYFVRSPVNSGSFTVTGTGSSESEAAADAEVWAALRADELAAHRHWRTGISYEPETSSVTMYQSTVTASWRVTGQALGQAYGILPNASGEASAVGLQAATGVAQSDAYFSIPSDSTFLRFSSSVVSGYNDDAGQGPVGHWAVGWAWWERTGTVTGSGTGATAAAAEASALTEADASAPGRLSDISYSTSSVTNTVVTVTATAIYNWERDAEEGSSTDTRGAPSPAAPPIPGQ